MSVLEIVGLQVRGAVTHQSVTAVECLDRHDRRVRFTLADLGRW
jgi:hypothetical protein